MSADALSYTLPRLGAVTRRRFRRPRRPNWRALMSVVYDLIALVFAELERAPVLGALFVVWLVIDAYWFERTNRRPPLRWSVTELLLGLLMLSLELAGAVR